MKKLLSVILAVAMLLSLASTALAVADPNTLVIGTPAMNGDFIEGFGNSAYDAYIKRVTFGSYYSTIWIDSNDQMVVNVQVVKDHSTEVDADGNKTYTWTIFDDLKYSDGTAITAKDYVFGALYFSSPAWVEAGATGGSSGYGLLGYEAWEAGATDTFAAIKLIDEYTFSITIDNEFLPYFHELSYAGQGPYPMHVYAPNVDVVSDENGSKLIGKDVDQAAIEAERAELLGAIGALKAAVDAAAEAAKAAGNEALATALQDAYKPHATSQVIKDANYKVLLADLQNLAATERFAPTIACGPYKFVSFENQTVTLEINEYFKGDQEGKKPTIKNVVQKYIPQDTDVDQVISGDVDVVTGVIEGAKIEAAKASDTAKTHSYFRNGYGYLAMHCDWGVTEDINVRWALGYLLDRNEVISYVLGGYGGTVHSQYGFAQWMYDEMGADLEEELIAFNLNLQTANEYLDKTEWKFEADGTTPFDASKANAEGTYLRHNAAKEPLTINHMGSENNTVTDIIEIQYTANAPLAGMKFVVTKADFNALLDNYYYGFQKGDERLYNTFNLAVTFGRPFDPYDNWHSDFLLTYQNSCQLGDAELDAAIMTMRNLESTQKEEYLDAWMKFEIRFQELLPQIPLYSNEYYDIMGNNVEGFNTTPFATWEYIICDVTKTAN
jgi:Bacterial extracellular solute-binding proteins, family 5 Middle.